MNLLNNIQKKLKVPKGQVNSFGGFKYRSCEDILEAVKPLLGDGVLIIEDEIVQVGDRYYIKATAQLFDGMTVSKATAFAREPESKTKMDDAQVTGSSSSYARKYALNGLFLIDDVKDADTMDNTATGQNKANKTISGKNDAKFMEDLQTEEADLIKFDELLESSKDLKELRSNWSKLTPMAQDKLLAKKNQLKIKLGGQAKN